MRKHFEIRIPRRLVKGALVLAIVSAVIAPIAVSASHQFSDVPDTNIFHSNIAWMADNNITAGCNPPTNDMYCPSDNVTREQMAAFMQRLAESQAVDAGTLSGVGPSGYLSVVGASTGSHAHGTALGFVGAGPTQVITSVTVDAPEDGVLIIDGSSGWEGGDLWVVQWFELNQATPCDAWVSTDRLSGSGVEANANSFGATAASMVAVEVPAGTHTIDMCLWPFSASSSSLNVSFSLVADWKPVSSSEILPAAGGGAGVDVVEGPSSN